MSAIRIIILVFLSVAAVAMLGSCARNDERLALFLGPAASSFVDEAGNLTFDDIVRQKSKLFEQNPHSAPNEGVSVTAESRFWLAFASPDVARLSEADWTPPFVLTVNEPRIRSAELFIRTAAGTAVKSWNSRDVRRLAGEGFRHPVFILEPESLAGAELFLAIETPASMQGLVWLYDFQSFIGAYDGETLTLAIIIGLMSAVFLYTLALGLSLPSRTSLWLAAVVFSGLAFIVSDNALLETVFAHGAAGLSSILAMTSKLMIYCSFTGLMASFLRLRWRLPQAFRVARILTLGLAAAAVLSIGDELLGTAVMRPLSPFLGVGSILFNLVVAVWMARTSPRRPILFLLAFSPAMVAGLARLFSDVAPGFGADPAAETRVLLGTALSLVMFTVLASVEVRQRERRLTREIQHNADRFRAFAEIGTDVFWEIDGKGRLTFFTGRPIGPAAFRTGALFLDELAAATSDSAIAPLRAAVDAGEPFDDRRLRLAQAGDGDLWISLSGRPMPPSAKTAGKAVYRGLVRDVSNEVEREGRRVIEQQMFALGQLAGSVAHEINNLIHPIINLTKRLRIRNQIHDDKEGDRMMDLIDLSSRQAAKVVSELLQTMRGERLKDIDRPISLAIEQGVEAIRPALPSSVQIDLAIDELPGPTVRVGDILQIVGNLASNAVHAMNGQGRIRVSLSATDKGARLAVADDGSGMDESVRRRALQPFFSTKTDGRGTGVGLYIVQRIVRDYDGWINIESALGQGTTVTIFFPNGKGYNGTARHGANGAGG